MDDQGFCDLMAFIQTEYTVLNITARVERVYAEEKLKVEKVDDCRGKLRDFLRFYCMQNVLVSSFFVNNK